MKPIDVDEVERYLRTVPSNSKVYIGADSSKFKRNGIWYTEIASVVVIHLACKHGCKIFYETVVERDWDADKRKPRTRLLNEVQKIAELYTRLELALIDFEVEIHIDINRDKKYASSLILDEAIGYIKGMTGLDALVKPDSWAASIAADRMLH